MFETHVKNGNKVKNATFGDKVTMHVTGKLKNGKVFASTHNTNPITCTLGDSELLPGIENAVIGMKPGETKKQIIPENEGFGPHDDRLLLKVKQESLPDYIQPEVGLELEVSRGNSPRKRMRIEKIEDPYVVLNANHPLAGKDLQTLLLLILQLGCYAL